MQITNIDSDFLSAWKDVNAAVSYLQAEMETAYTSIEMYKGHVGRMAAKIECGAQARKELNRRYRSLLSDCYHLRKLLEKIDKELCSKGEIFSATSAIAAEFVREAIDMIPQDWREDHAKHDDPGPASR